jgi:hypothetical protein
MTTKKRPIPKPKAVIRARRLTIGRTELARLYGEVLYLRQAVHQAESRSNRAIVSVHPNQKN